MEIEFTPLVAGSCRHLEKSTYKGGRWKQVVFPSMFYLIKHPQRGYILYDTGYSDRFLQETRTFPNKIYKHLTPIIENSIIDAKEQLLNRGISPEEISYLVISHFHADHIGGIKDFPRAEFIYFNSAYKSVCSLKGITRVLNGFLPDHLPKKFLEKSKPIDEVRQRVRLNPLDDVFERTFDIFGDQSLIAVDLSGHVEGQLGLYFKSEGKEKFLIADSCWQSESYRKNVGPHFIASILMKNKGKYYKTLSNIHNLFLSNSEMEIIPSHCGECFSRHIGHPTMLHKDLLLNGVY